MRQPGPQDEDRPDADLLALHADLAASTEETIALLKAFDALTLRHEALAAHVRVVEAHRDALAEWCERIRGSLPGRAYRAAKDVLGGWRARAS